MAVFKKTLTKTDIEKRLSIPTVKKQCFLEFGGKDKVKFTATDENHKDWVFVCSRRKKEKSYPKPVLSRGWLQFVHEWKLAIGDIVTLDHPKTGKGHYRIAVIRKSNLPYEVPPSPVKKRKASGASSYGSVTDNESAIITNNSSKAITYHRNDSCRDKPQSSADSICTELKLSSAGLGSHMQLKEPICRRFNETQSRADSIDSELKLTHLTLRPYVQQETTCIDFFALESQKRGKKEEPSFQNINHMVESPFNG